MILNGGALNGKRYLSDAAVREMTTRQTAEAIQNAYGLGWDVSNGEIGHGGAYATDMRIDVKRGLILIWMVQHDGFPGDGAKSKEAFKRAAAAFAK
jgi:CubicO group peptidase (beta-lactamase class C family)